MDYPRDISWEDFISHSGTDTVDCVPLRSMEPAFISYTSGSTGNPKGIVMSTIGYAFWCSAWKHCRIECNCTQEFTPSHIGWASGLISTLSPLFQGIAGIIFDGDATGTPDPSTFYRIISQYKVTKVLINSATLRDWRIADPDGKFGKQYNIPSLKMVTCGGEPIDSASQNWCLNVLGQPLRNVWGQTEGVFAFERNDEPISENPPLQPIYGCDFQIINDDGKKVPPNEAGNIVVKLPGTPTMISTVYKNDKLYKEFYYGTFPGYFDTKDLGWIDCKGGLHIACRKDDVFKVSGIRLTTTEIEGVIRTHKDIEDCFVLVLKHTEKNAIPVGFYKLKSDTNTSSEIVLNDVMKLVSNSISPMASFTYAIHVKKFPMTPSGKVDRKTLFNAVLKVLPEVSDKDNPTAIRKTLMEACSSIGLL